jgi:hypothetical protein
MPTISSAHPINCILNGKSKYFHASGLLQNASSGFSYFMPDRTAVMCGYNEIMNTTLTKPGVIHDMKKVSILKLDSRIFRYIGSDSSNRAGITPGHPVNAGDYQMTDILVDRSTVG